MTSQANAPTYYPMSLQQRSLWQGQGVDRSYVAQAAFTFAGELVPAQIQKRVDAAVSRHQILRTTFQPVAGMRVPLQAVAESASINPIMLDLCGLGTDAREKALHDVRIADSASIGNLSDLPLLRCTLVRTDAHRHILLLTAPLLVCDAHSLLTLARGLLSHEEQEMEVPVQYAQYCEWQSELLNSEDAATAREHWKTQLSRTIPLAQLPFETADVRGDRQSTVVECTVTVDIEGQSSRGSDREYSLESAALTCWAAILARNIGESRTTVHTMFDGRTDPALASALGLFERVVPVTAELDFESSFDSAALRVQQLLNDHADAQDVFEPCVDALPPGFSFRFEAWRPFSNELRNAAVLDTSVRSDRSKLQIRCAQTSRSLNVRIAGVAGSFTPEDINRLAVEFKTAVECALRAPDTRISALPLQPPVPHERRELAFFEDRQCIHARIKAQVEASPDSRALVYQDHVLSYRELDAKAEQIAALIFASGATRGARVALCADRSHAVVIAVLGALKAGCAYIPLDSEWPTQRIVRILNEAQAAAVILDTGAHERLRHFQVPPVIRMDELTHSAHLSLVPSTNIENGRREPANPGDAAYVMFTSGSTGSPKGVIVEHAQLDSYVQAITSALNFHGGMRYAHVSTFAADLGNTVLFPSLCTGGCLHVIPRSTCLDPGALAAYMSVNRIDVLKIVPTHFAALLAGCSNPAQLFPTTCLILGGEPLRWDLIDKMRQVGPQCAIVNHYGPTETTVGVAMQLVGTATRQLRQTVPIGSPLANAEFYVLDEVMQEVPAWVPGQLYIGGSCVARGYLNAPDLTASRFVPNVFGEGRLYKSGDTVRKLPDNTYEFLGRSDDQVKINGFRVDPNELQTVLAEHPGISEVFVTGKPPATAPRLPEHAAMGLIAYVALKAGIQVSAEELRSFARDRVPEHMVPTIVLVPRLPLTSNGKVDRQRLPEPETMPFPERKRIQPRTPIEMSVADIWCKMLRRDSVSIDDDFFSLGGDSLIATQAIARLRMQFGCELSIRDFFDSPNVEALSLRILELSLEATANPNIDSLLREVETQAKSASAHQE